MPKWRVNYASPYANYASDYAPTDACWTDRERLMDACFRDLDEDHQGSQPQQRIRPAGEKEIDQNWFRSAKEDDESDAGPVDDVCDHRGVNASAIGHREDGEVDGGLLNDGETPGGAKFGSDCAGRIWRFVLHD